MRRTPRSHDGSQARDASCSRLGHRAKVCPDCVSHRGGGRPALCRSLRSAHPTSRAPVPPPLGTGARAWNLRRNRRHAKYHPAIEPQQQFLYRSCCPPGRTPRSARARRAQSSDPGRPAPAGAGGRSLHSATQHTSPHRMCARTPGREAHCTNWCTGAGTHPPRGRRMHRSGPSGNRLTDRTGAHPSVRPVVLPRPTGHRRPPLHRRGGRSLSCPARALPLATRLATRVRLLCWRKCASDQRSSDSPAVVKRRTGSHSAFPLVRAGSLGRADRI